ncbi:tetratricopeptide repeat protein [Streptomyces aquilus]|uniref:tetratricopeptide repeat protein n=1 Tax=Streptomyces aquilus TaxID=2548456 RepID=UPI0036ABF5F8
MAGAGSERYDVFFSYAHGDGEWPVALAENLQRLGLTVWIDQQEIVGGQLVATRLQDGLARSAAVVAVVTPKWIASKWCDEEFAAAVTGAVAGQQRLIPVLWGSAATIPPFLASRSGVDFRTVATPDQYRAKVRELHDAVRELPTASPPGGAGPVIPPKGLAYRSDGPIHAELRIGAESVVFATEGAEVSVGGPEPEASQLYERLRDLRSVRRRERGDRVTRTAPAPDSPLATAGVNRALDAVGRTLGERFVNGDVAAALQREVELARGCNAPLRIGLRVDAPEWRDLPWESVVVSGAPGPLVLSENVDLYRVVRRDAPPVAHSVPGPLRILAVVASPERDGGALLDYEKELALILDAVGSARTRQGAYVRVLNWGSVSEIRAALEEERFHVLHLSCHAGPGVLYLEQDDGRVDEVDARRFMDEVLPPGRGVPLVVLSGCSTAQAPEPAAEDATAEARAGLARELLARGVPSVLAMTEAVTDPYATELAACVYEELARAEHPVPLTALSRARRRLEAVRRRLPAGDPWAEWPEWSIPALFLAGPPVPLFDAAGATQPVTPAPERLPEEGMVVRKVGEFVGRRAELRHLLTVLRDSRQAGALIHGIGGVGKSTLTAELLHHLGAEAGLVVPVPAGTSPTVDSVLEILRKRLLAHCVTAGVPDGDPLRRAAAELVNASPPWRDRWDLIRQVVLPRLPALLVLDNAEDLLESYDGERRLSDPELADFLAAWASAAPHARLLVTSRFPFALPQRMHRRLTAHHLGPLSLAETRKLIWRLPALDALRPEDLRRAYTDVGGHPRALEYLDALLRGGEARFPDIADRMEEALERRGVRDPRRWLAGVAGDLDKALAETVTLAVDDVLLDTLLGQLDGVPGARHMLDGLAVYRRPVDWVGAFWQLSELTATPEPDPVLEARMQLLSEQISEARAPGPQGTDGEGPSQQLVDQYRQLGTAVYVSPVRRVEGAGDALGRLLELGLVSPAPQDDVGGPPTGLVVHRWTADALQNRSDREALMAAHRRAGAYCRWRFNVLLQDKTADIIDLVEARHHHYLAGDLDEAVSVNGHVCKQLHDWGAWDWEEQLLKESLSWYPVDSRPTSDYLHQLGLIAHARGDLAEAEARCREALAIRERLGERNQICTSYHFLGAIAQERENFDEAEEHFQRALAISEELGLRANTASTIHQLGLMAFTRGDLAQAEALCRDSLAIGEELGDRTGAAARHHFLGVIAMERKNLDEAEEQFRHSLAISEGFGVRANIGITTHQLGRIEEERAEYVKAEEYYRISLAISEELGDLSGIAATTSQLGVMRTKMELPAQGVPYNLQALVLRLQLGLTPAIDLGWLSWQRSLLGDEAFEEVVREHMTDESTEQILSATLPQPGTPD